MDRIDAAVIGAGVIGLAIARALSRAGRSVLILEAEARFGTVTSARNSEVIHAGFHYAHGSLKERLCLRGKQLLYEHCASRHVTHARIGKLTFAADESQRESLEAIARHAREAQADDDLRWLEEREAAALEPALACAAAILSPSSGIVDSHALMLSLLAEAEDHGAVLACHAPVSRIEAAGSGWRVHSGETRIEAGLVINAAGLGAQSLAAATDALDAAHVPPLVLAKGSYFAYAGAVPFTRLIYPVPIKGGHGTHLVLDTGGQARFGPDVEWTEAIDYAVDPARKADFAASIRRFWPGIDPDRLHPGYAGMRPKLATRAEPDADFRIDGPQTHGLSGLVNLFGIESPGLTASLAVGEYVADLLR